VLRTIAAIAIALLMVFIAMWTIVPAPNLPTLALAVAVPELALPLIAIFALVSVGAVLLARGPARVLVIALCIFALGALAMPLASVSATWTHAAAALRAARIEPLRAQTVVALQPMRTFPVPLRDGGALALDLYRPRVAGKLPLIVTIYGGAWIFGSRRDEAPLARWYASHGFAVAVIDYRHAPTHRFPAQIDDVDDALDTIALDADAWNVDRERVVLFGRSAGAQLALLAGERPQLLGVRGIVAYYAPTDLIDGWNEPPQPDPAGTRRILTAFLGGSPERLRAVYAAAAPLTNAHAGMPPVLAIIGDRDELVRPEFQRSFAARLTTLHVRNSAIELPWANHAFDAVNGLGAALAHDATLRFTDSLLRPHE
jgi:acetyl esterase/lipase